jgi:hypothetical protein
MRLSEIYRQKKKHIDADHIGDSFLNYTKFPTTFDGSLPSEAFGAASSRVKIGDSYLFQNVGGANMVGTVTYATVHESDKKAAIAVTFTDGTCRILMQPMTDAEFSDYKAHPDAYFGTILPVPKEADWRATYSAVLASHRTAFCPMVHALFPWPARKTLACIFHCRRRARCGPPAQDG